MDLIVEITIFVLAAFVGFEVISKVPTTPHAADVADQRDPRIVMIGGLIVIGLADDPLEKTIGVIAIAFDDQHRRRFMVTDRMLSMFADVRTKARGGHLVPLAVIEPGGDLAHRALHRLVFAVHPRRPPRHAPTTARQGNLIAATGMAIAVGTTLLLDGIGNWGLHRRARDRHRRRSGRVPARADDRDAADGRATTASAAARWR